MLQSHPQASRAAWPIAEYLGWLSVGLGVAALLAPRKIGDLSGLDDKDGLIRLVGARELVSGIGLLSQSNKSPWLWARVVGDAIDLAVLATAHRGTSRDRSRTLSAAAVVAAITAADVAAGLRHSNLRRGYVAPDVYIERSIIVNKTAEECYNFWRDLRNIPSFTRRLEKVTPIDERSSHWIMKVPGGRDLEWISELTEDKPGERLRWRSAEGAPVEHAGSVSFKRAPGNRGTMVTAGMHYPAPGGAAGAALARFLGPDPFAEVRENLRRFKQLIETGEIPTTAGQPSGRRSLLGLFFAEGRLSRQGPGLRTTGTGRSRGSGPWESGPLASHPAASAPGEGASDASTLREGRIS